MELEKFYYDPSHYAGYSATANLSRAAKPNFTRNEVIDWLKLQDAYTLHRPVRRKFPRLHYNVTNIDDLWEADLIDLRNLKSYNDGYSYLLTVIDALSKFVWVEPLRDKTGSCVVKAFQRIFSRNNDRLPVYLQTDKGYRSRLQSHSSTIKMQPAVVTRENARVARENMIRRWNDIEQKKNRGCRQKAKYSARDFVRVSRAKAAFEKGYEAKWSEEIFRIHRVLEWRKPRVYELSDLAGEVIDGFFYEQELAPVIKDLQGEEFIVERVIKSKGRGNKKQLLVSWQGYPSKFDSWIPAESLKILDKNEGG
ncbi:uncharacterized protein LOC126852566 [Cataglyphis hispanica]|uniref:uncharacterized protein LOC126852566 n=1 Tax=Cataglyphis hispanica TaxID=1086592 RepID=UPI00217F77CA|nr:uncharacterized protein LOC126852566 [Cataglyphis hispanica]